MQPSKVSTFSILVVIRARIAALLITNGLSMNAASKALGHTAPWLSRKMRIQDTRRPLTLANLDDLVEILIPGSKSGALLDRVTLTPSKGGLDAAELQAALGAGLAYMAPDGPRFSPLAALAIRLATPNGIGIRLVEDGQPVPIREGADICADPACPNRVFYGDECRRHYDAARST